jgi:hypothetical protein
MKHKNAQQKDDEALTITESPRLEVSKQGALASSFAHAQQRGALQMA